MKSTNVNEDEDTNFLAQRFFIESPEALKTHQKHSTQDYLCKTQITASFLKFQGS